MKNGIVLLSCIFEPTVFGMFNLWPIYLYNEPAQVCCIKADGKKDSVATCARVAKSWKLPTISLSPGPLSYRDAS